MTYLCVLKNIEVCENDIEKYWCFIEIQFIKDDIKLLLSEPIESNYSGNMMKWNEYVPTNKLNSDKFYLFYENKILGYKNPNKDFVKFENNIDTIKAKIFDLLLEENIILKNIVP